MEDPVFDPWSISEPDSDPTPTHHTARWRSTVEDRGVPLMRPIPKAIPRQPIHGPAPLGVAGSLQALLMPQLERLIQRLEMARHETTMDDRLDQPTPSLRFRIRPRRGPFDEGRARDGAVLEILVEGPSSEVVGRLWLDPLREKPSERIRVDATKLTAAWVNRLLFDFVEKALRQG